MTKLEFLLTVTNINTSSMNKFLKHSNTLCVNPFASAIPITYNPYNVMKSKFRPYRAKWFMANHSINVWQRGSIPTKTRHIHNIYTQIYWSLWMTDRVSVTDNDAKFFLIIKWEYSSKWKNGLLYCLKLNIILLTQCIDMLNTLQTAAPRKLNATIPSTAQMANR